MELKVCFLGAVRRRTFICCRNVRISASSAARDRNRSTTIQTMSLTRSLIPRQHRPILDQLLVRLSLRQGHGLGGSAKLSVTDDYQNEAAMIDCAPLFCGLLGNSSATVLCHCTAVGRDGFYRSLSARIASANGHRRSDTPAAARLNAAVYSHQI
jgi:hypothetical protein